MSPEPEPRNPFVLRMVEYFGPLPGQSDAEFADELQELSDEDKREFDGFFAQATCPFEVRAGDPPKAA